VRRDLDAEVALEVPGDLVRAEVVRGPQVDDLVLDRLRRPKLVILGARSAADQPRLATALVGMKPVVVALARDPEVSARLGDVAVFSDVVEDVHLALDVTLGLGHRRPPFDAGFMPIRQARSGISNVLRVTVRSTR